MNDNRITIAQYLEAAIGLAAIVVVILVVAKLIGG
jgi:hypothetical protein